MRCKSQNRAHCVTLPLESFTYRCLVDGRRELHRNREHLMVRLAIHPADITDFNLPPQRIKTTDSGAAGFKQRFGARAATVELDALSVDELRRRVGPANQDPAAGDGPSE